MTGHGRAGILLTGGASRRLGFDKATARRDGRTLAEAAAGLLAAACPVVVEVGDGASGLRSVRESPAGQGPLVAVLAGVAALGAEAAGGVVVLACDVVHLPATLLRALADTETDPADTVVPVVDGRSQFTVARYGPAWIAEAAARAGAGERSLRWTLDWAGDVVALPLPSGAIADVDTPADAQRWSVVESDGS